LMWCRFIKKMQCFRWRRSGKANEQRCWNFIVFAT
jgi:hypothetical protein